MTCGWCATIKKKYIFCIQFGENDYTYYFSVFSNLSVDNNNIVLYVKITKEKRVNYKLTNRKQQK